MRGAPITSCGTERMRDSVMCCMPDKNQKLRAPPFRLSGAPGDRSSSLGWSGERAGDHSTLRLEYLERALCQPDIRLARRRFSQPPPFPPNAIGDAEQIPRGNWSQHTPMPHRREGHRCDAAALFAIGISAELT